MQLNCRYHSRKIIHYNPAKALGRCYDPLLDRRRTDISVIYSCYFRPAILFNIILFLTLESPSFCIIALSLRAVKFVNDLKEIRLLFLFSILKVEL